MTIVEQNADESAQHRLPADLPTRAVKLAAEILRESRKRETSQERGRSAQMARMMQDENGKKFTIVMADQVLKINEPRLAASRLGSILRQYGVPQYLSALNRTALWAAGAAAKLMPGMVMPQINRQVRRESAHVIVSAEPQKFANYVRERQAAKFRINFNQLGEAVLGDEEAARRHQAYLQRLAEPEIVYASVKLSSVVSQISMTGYRDTIELIKPKLRELYRAAIKHGGEQPKFVNLDMEEYRDLHMTVDVFCEVLDELEFERLEAGIVLQAYLPDSFAMQQRLTEWAKNRKARTGAGIKIRLVKGANLAMEQVEASLRGWRQAPYESKPEVDANYKRMLEFGTRAENISAVRLGIASHNLFDVAYALLVREHRQIAERLEFEMLEGMANAQAAEVRERSGGMVVYTPAVPDDEFEAAIAYLVRRLDENTAPGSFLGALFALEEGTAEWRRQSEAFLLACREACAASLSSKSNRHQDRQRITAPIDDGRNDFQNEPDTDFSLPANRAWADGIIADWKTRKIEVIPLEIGGKKIEKAPTGQGKDPSRKSQVVYEYTEAGEAEVYAALDVAVAAQPGWNALGIEGRKKILQQVARVFSEQRGETIGCMMLDAGKAILEGDVEVSEAIDFANYYSRSLDWGGLHDGSQMRPRGVVVVTPPWNFPYAIPAGGCLAALMAGNSVILKPSRESVLTAYTLAKQLWEAGVPRDVLQFLPVGDRVAGKQLVVDPRTAVVILTGSYDTAKNFLSWRPELPLFAETSGKNSLIITAFADQDLAVKDLVRGAFGHSGQKCSATSLALVEKSVYDSKKFQHQLLDATKSLIADGSWNPSAIATPVIRPPDENLKRGLTTLEPGETWLLEPRMLDENPCMWTPGIKLGVKPGSWYHRTECFGPVLGLIRVESFEEALRIQNSNEFGLTGGLHSLEPEEIRVWREKVEVGNAYINRSTTGAIVRRQPFGGWKNSVVGLGSKAGGPNYVAGFGLWSEVDLPKTQAPLSENVKPLVARLKGVLQNEAVVERMLAAAGSYQHWWNVEFSQEHDPSQVHGESNHFRYRPRPWHVLRIGKLDEQQALEIAALTSIACRLAGVELEVSSTHPADWMAQFSSASDVQPFVESHEQLVARLGKMRDGTLRAIGIDQEFRPDQIGNVYVTREEPLANGRLELLNYLREQSMSQTTHRYGNII
jgi:RHH-type transcriptional regulator, proline utilization regulon repressor / proline dehydrogenase / delta 1-pyrroline-5-carboxylate dehydrogenase